MNVCFITFFSQNLKRMNYISIAFAYFIAVLIAAIGVEIGLQRHIQKTGTGLRSLSLGSFRIHARNLQEIMTENQKSMNSLSLSLV